MPSLDDLAKGNKLALDAIGLREHQVDRQKTDDLVARKEQAAKEAAGLFQQGDVQGAIARLAQENPEFIQQSLPQLEKMIPGIKDRISFEDEDAKLRAQAKWGQLPTEQAKARGSAAAKPIVKSIFNPKTGQTELYSVDPETGATTPVMLPNQGGAGAVTGFAPQFIRDPLTGNIIHAQPGTGGVNEVQAPSQVKNEQKLQEAVKRGTEEDPKSLYAKLNDKSQRSHFDSLSKDFMKDSKEDRDAVLNSTRIVQLLDEGKELNSDILRAFQNSFAKAFGERQLTERDVEPFGGEADVFSRLERYASMELTGQLPDEDRKFLSGLAQLMGKTGQRMLDQRAEPYAQKLATQTSLNTDQARKLLTQGSDFLNPSSSTKSQPPQTKTVMVKELGQQVRVGQKVKDKKTGKILIVQADGTMK
jgi:hypothetical protein